MLRTTRKICTIFYLILDRMPKTTFPSKASTNALLFTNRGPSNLAVIMNCGYHYWTCFLCVGHSCLCIVKLTYLSFWFSYRPPETHTKKWLLECRNVGIWKEILPMYMSNFTYPFFSIWFLPWRWGSLIIITNHLISIL